MHRALRSITLAVAVLGWTGTSLAAHHEKEEDVAIVSIDEFIAEEKVAKSKSGW